MKREEFIKKMAKVELIENTDCYGHYPFQGFARKGDKTELLSLAFGGDVMKVYDTIKERLLNGYYLIHVVLDFPAQAGIENDFMCILTFENNSLEVSAIPYDTNTGELFDEITGDVLDNVKTQTIEIVYGEKRGKNVN